METIKILFVEDNQSEIDNCLSIVKAYKRKKNIDIEIVDRNTVEDAVKILDNSFDGAIIDLKLDKGGDEGNQVVEQIMYSFRIPVVIHTATPSDADDHKEAIPVYKKGEITYEELFDKFSDIYKTGLTKIMGGRGVIESTMRDIFWNNLLPMLGDWQKHKSRGKETEKALLRYVVSHLIELLDETEVIAFPEEMYISPPISKNIKTGSIVQDKDTKGFYVVLSPACDLVVHNGNIKTDSILVCQIETTLISKAQQDFSKTILDTDDDDGKKDRITKAKERANQLFTDLPGNKRSYYHYLPRTSRFEGGVINFRRVFSFKPTDFKKKFGQPIHQLSMAFVKDIVARFSSYYSRQGQPDFDFEELSRNLKGE